MVGSLRPDRRPIHPKIVRIAAVRAILRIVGIAVVRSSQGLYVKHGGRGGISNSCAHRKSLIYKLPDRNCCSSKDWKAIHPKIVALRRWPDSVVPEEHNCQEFLAWTNNFGVNRLWMQGRSAAKSHKLSHPQAATVVLG